MTRAFLPAVLMVLVVAAGCSDPDVKLRGKREPVTAILTDGGAQLNAPQENQSRSFEAPAQKNNLSWPQGHGTPKTRTTHPALAAALAKAWSASIGRGDRQRSRISADPIVVDGMIVTLDSQSVLVATSASGARLWSLDLTPVGEQSGEADGGGIASGGGRIYVTTGYGEMAAVDPKTGEKIWSQSLMALAAGRPAYADGLVYVVSGGATSWAVEADNGRVRWQVDGLSDLNMRRGSTGPAVSDKLVLFGYGSGDVQAAFRKGGLVLWTATLAGARSGQAISTIGGIGASPVISGKRVYAANASGRLVAMNLDSGARLWTAPHGALTPLWVAGGSVFLINDIGQLVRVDARNGQTIWAVDLPTDKTSLSWRSTEVIAHHGPILAGRRLIVASGDGLLRQFNPESGEELEAIKIPSGATTSPVVADGVLYVVSKNGKLHAFR
ncbi:MAG: PQQ-binding-like beta-propeller repeat protein [Paracoccaceae bacterium]